MDRNQTYMVLASIGIVVLAWAAAPLLAPRLQPGPPLSQAALGLDAPQALARTTEFVTRNPRRVMGSLESRQSSGYIQQYLRGLGYEVNYLHFEDVIAGRKQVGRNVLALKPGRDRRIVAVMAHYDTAATTLQGAMDDGSGVGVLLELARVFASTPTNHSLLFVASDGEEWGMLGAADFAQNYPEKESLTAVLSLDYVAVGTLAALQLDTSGQFGGYTAPWLRDIARRAIRAENLPIAEPAGVEEHLERALLLSWTDQGPLLAAGIEALNLGSVSQDKVREHAVYHSSNDTADNLRVDSFASFGRTAERILRTLDETQAPPDQSPEYFRIKDGAFLPGAAVGLLHLLTFVPLAVALAFYGRNYGRHVTFRAVQREGLTSVATLLPFLLFYWAILLSRGLRLLPRYAVYPATPKDPLLDHPHWGVLAGIAALAAAAAVVLYFGVRYVNRSLPRPDFHLSKLILLAFLLAVSAGALVYNSYWAVSFVALPAWFWAIAGPADSTGGRAANRLWIAAAGIVYYLASAAYAARLGLGWKLLWYEVLALSTGMFHFTGYLLAALVCALGLRFIAIQSLPRSG